jgi:hypothetical protein
VNPLPLATLCPLLPRQASCQSPTSGSSSLVRAPCFPQRVWTTHCSKPCRLLGHKRRGLLRQRYGAALAWRCQPRAKRWWPAVVARARAVSQGHQVAPQASGPAGTALRRQGRSVARAAGPRHRRPRLRHRTRRRGAASAASRPPQARARVVEKVRLSVQRSADRSTRPLGRTKAAGRVAPASGWAARHGLHMGLAAPYPAEVAALRGRSSGL